MYPRTRTTLAILAAAFWAAAIGVLIYAIEINVPRIPVFGFFAIAGSMFGLAWFNLFIHRNGNDSAAAMAAAAPSAPATVVDSMAADCNAPTVRLRTRIPPPRPRPYSCDPDPALDATQLTIEMVPVRDVTPKIVRAYNLGDANGYDRAVADMAGVRLDGDART